MYEASALTIGSGLSTALGQYSKSQSALGQGDFLADQDNYRSRVALQDAQDRAQMIRRAGARAVGTAQAVTAKSGIVVGTGSAGDVERQLDTDIEHDAYTALLEGSRRARAFQVDAIASRANAKAQSNIAKAQLIGTVLSSGFSAYKSWGSSGGAFDLGGYNGTNDRGTFSGGSATDWFQKYGRGGD